MKKRPWTEQEKCLLRVCYERQTPIKMVANLLKRSPTSIHKALTYFGIRPLGAKTGPKKPVTSYPSAEDLLKEASKYFQTHPEPPVKKTAPCPDFYKSPTSVSIDRQKLAKEAFVMTVSLQELLHYLKSHGIILHKSFHLDNRPYWLLDKKIVSKTHLLCKANEIRLREGLPRFYMPDMSEV